MTAPTAAAKLVTTNALTATPSRGEAGACVESAPADPQDHRAENHKRNVVWLDSAPHVAAPADKMGSGYGCHAGVDMDHRAAGKVHRAYAFDPSVFCPNPVADRQIDQSHPQHKEQQVGAELESLGKRAGDKGRRDDGEHHLKGREQHDGNAVALRRAYVSEAGIVEVSDEVVEPSRRNVCRGPERQAVAVQRPDDHHHAHGYEAVHHGADDIFAAHQSAVEESDARRHEQHQH